MSFIFSAATKITARVGSEPIRNAINILRRDMNNVFYPSETEGGNIILDGSTGVSEDYKITVGKDIVVTSEGDLGFVYALLYISEKFLGVKPFWFWTDTLPQKRESVEIEEGEYLSPKYAVRFRGWFFNDEVLLLKWKLNGDAD